MEGVWYFVFLLFSILLLLAIPYTKNILSTNTPEVLYFISTFIFFFADVKSDSSDIFLNQRSWKELNDAFILTGCLTYFAGLIFSVRRNDKYIISEELKKSLKKEIEKRQKVHEEYYDLCSDNIRHIFNDFIGTTNGNGRVSIYKHQGTHFTLLGRYSPNTTFNKRGRVSYPDNEGFISLGWENGRYNIDSIRAYTGRGRAYITDVNQVRNIDETVIKRMSMRSRSFYIKRIDDQNHAQNPFGIIVFEKMDPSAIDEVMVDNIIANYQPQIMFLLKSMKSLDRIENA